jgi:hypothetical protein
MEPYLLEVGGIPFPIYISKYGNYISVRFLKVASG